MKNHFRRAALQTAFALLIPLAWSASPSRADEPDKSEWPCVYRKVPFLSAATIWDGPEIKDTTSWHGDEKIRTLSQYLISRRINEDEAEAAIKKYAASLPADQHDAKLTELFTAVLARTNDDRKIVMSGIERFHKRQMERATEIEKEGVQLPPENEIGLSDESTSGEISKLSSKEEKYKWEVRTFQEKQANIPIACEIPQLIDQRAGDIARAIRAEMKS
jgi:hypothetical protein